MIKKLTPSSIAELQYLVDTFDTSFEEIQNQIINALILPRIDEITDENLLDLLAWQLHIEGYELATTIEQKQSMIKNAFLLHKYKGTPYAIKQVFQSLGITAELQEWFQYGGNPYMFRIWLDTVISDEETYIELVKLINEYKNIRSWLDTIGVHREYTDNVYIGSALDDGKYYTVQTHLPSVSLKNIDLFVGTANMISSKEKIIPKLPDVNIEGINTYIGSANIISSKERIIPRLPNINIDNTNTYIATANMISSQYRITTHLPKSVENASLYVAGAVMTSSYIQIATGGNN
jgi:phage tail P2-like protein